jgi:hypothetical protein
MRGVLPRRRPALAGPALVWSSFTLVAACQAPPSPLATPAPPLAPSSAKPVEKDRLPDEVVAAPLAPRTPTPTERAAKRLAGAVFEAFSNVEPRPVVREQARQPWVQFLTDRRRSGGKEPPSIAPFGWQEAPVRWLHGGAVAAASPEPCQTPLVLDEDVAVRGGSYRLERGAVADRLSVDNGKIAVALPRGAYQGGCVVEERRLWLAWSTPSRPAELFTVTLRDGRVRPLRDEARPSLGGLAELATDVVSLPAQEPPGRVVEGLRVREKTERKQRDEGAVALVWLTAEEAAAAGPTSSAPPPASLPLAAYRPVVRALVEVGADVLLTSPAGRGGGGAVRRADVAALAKREGRRLWEVRATGAPTAVVGDSSGILSLSSEAEPTAALAELLVAFAAAQQAAAPPSRSPQRDEQHPGPAER